MTSTLLLAQKPPLVNKFLFTSFFSYDIIKLKIVLLKGGDTMKRFISILLATCMLLSVAVMLSGCNLFKNKIDSGTEAAKLLLANERLDENTVGAKIDLGLGDTRAIKAASIKPEIEIESNKAPVARGNILVLSNELKPVSHTWTRFDTFSYSMVEFTQFMRQVEFEAERVAEDIATMKNEVGATDKWVQVGYEKHMLRVQESRDILIVYGEYDDIHVYYRYTDENAKNVYEMYSIMPDEYGTSSIKTVLIPGERCEYFYIPSNGANDFFIAENTRGYWTATRFGHLIDPGYDREAASFFPYIIKDGLGYGFSSSIDTNEYLYNSSVEYEEGAEPTMVTGYYVVFDPINNRDLIRVSKDADFYNFTVFHSAIKSGLVSVSSDEAYDYTGSGHLDGRINKYTTTKGAYEYSEDASRYDSGFVFSSGDIRYDSYQEVYSGTLTFRVSASEGDMLSLSSDFVDFLASQGLELHCTKEQIYSSLEHSMLFSNDFDSAFKWYGYEMSSIDNVNLAMDLLNKDYEMAYQEYEAVKDFETFTKKQVLSNKAHFADLEIVLAGGNTFSGNTISLSGISAITEDVALFEQGMNYVLKVGLSLIDENGNPISVNTIPLKGTTSPTSPFNGDSITLSISGQYDVPKNLHEGKYVAVVYVATQDEGIRVSEMEKIAFVDIQGGEIESSAMAIEASNQDSNLIIEYKIKNSRHIAYNEKKELYTYEEIRKAIMVEILSYGAPYHGAKIEAVIDDVGVDVIEGTPFVAGTYRMMCYLQTSDGLAQSYVYIILN